MWLSCYNCKKEPLLIQTSVEEGFRQKLWINEKGKKGIPSGRREKKTDEKRNRCQKRKMKRKDGVQIMSCEAKTATDRSYKRSEPQHFWIKMAWKRKSIKEKVELVPLYIFFSFISFFLLFLP
ncbi:hypothetical protein CEXT_269881 [Caerostris extrusa]|uniref:Transmembrane protein n=1 Tax=Caerostris extrusa TaxID=172846 RepID=A0AAV4P3I7_CAEEX|nr:hypothetical protein CEXT_269881 [Caerostris extrusa]